MKLFQNSRDYGELVSSCSEAAAAGEGLQQAGGGRPAHQHLQQSHQVSCQRHNLQFFQRFDHSGKGELTEKELYNVLKMQNQVDCTRDEVKK